MADVDARRLSKTFKGKYRLENNTLKCAVKDNPKDSIEIEVGDSKQPDFKPQWKVSRWSNEVNFSIRAQEDPNATIEIVDDKVIYKASNYEVHQYEKPDASDEGGYEFEWVLPSKPDTNVLTATIRTKGLDFFYQPELTQEEIEQGCKRAENVVGSYAVYHSSNPKNIVGGKEYKTGKAFHIYRPKAIDVKGNEVWCSLDVDTTQELLQVTIPEDFLSSAQYPVTVDPTFGYTSAGASGYNMANGRITASDGEATPADAGTVTGMSAYIDVAFTGFKAIILEEVSSTQANIITDAVSNVSSPTAFTLAWVNFTFASNPTLVSSTTYWNAVICATANSDIMYDTVAGYRIVEHANNYTTPTNINGGTSQSTSKRSSIYITYDSASSSAQSTAGIITTLEKPSLSTSAIIATLEKPTQSTTALLTDLESATPSTTTYILGYLGGFYLGSVPLAGATEYEINSTSEQSTAGLLTILEKPTQSTTALNTTLEKPTQSTAALLTALEASPLYSTTALLTTLAAEPRVGSSRVDLQACKLEYSIVSPK